MAKLIETYNHKLVVGHPNYSDRLDLWNKDEDGQSSTWFGAIIREEGGWKPIGGVTQQMAEELVPMLEWFSRHAKD
jgi:hypothetical protein